jgi:hypothetical protein
VEWPADQPFAAAAVWVVVASAVVVVWVAEVSVGVVVAVEDMVVAAEGTVNSASRSVRSFSPKPVTGLGRFFELWHLAPWLAR